MSDLISRQAAIDAIKKCRSESDMPDMWYDGMSCALRCLYKLPSAQPKSYRSYREGIRRDLTKGIRRDLRTHSRNSGGFRAVRGCRKSLEHILSLRMMGQLIG